MNTLKTLIGMSGLIVALGGWSVANAATYTFNFAVSKGAAKSLDFGGTKINSNEAGPDKLSVTVSGGPSITGQYKGRTIPQTKVQSWSGNGLGVLNNEGIYWNQGWKYPDEHFVDNNGSDDFVLFDFKEKKNGKEAKVDVKVTKFVLQAWGDTDITINSGSVFKDIDDGKLVVDKNNKPILANNHYLYEFDLSDLTVSNSNLWRIFAQIGGEDKNKGYDKFKIYSLTASTSTVPLPAAVWLFGSALLGMVGIGYRRQTRQI